MGNTDDTISQSLVYLNISFQTPTFFQDFKIHPLSQLSLGTFYKKKMNGEKKFSSKK
jgi:hypothetical protein